MLILLLLYEINTDWYCPLYNQLIKKFPKKSINILQLHYLLCLRLLIIRIISGLMLFFQLEF